MRPSISIIIPLYNEEDNIEILYDEIRNSVDKLKQPYEIIFVDDGSIDTTLQRLKEIKKRHEKEQNGLAALRIIRFSRNFGQTTAMQAGFDYAQGAVIISMDGDLQNDPGDIPKLLKKLHEGYDLVCGWRKNRHDNQLTRIVPSKIANWLIRRLTGIPLHDLGCSLKAYRNSMMKHIRLYSDMHRFIPAMTNRTGAKVAEIVVNHRPRQYGTTKYGLSRIWKVLLDIITIKMLIHFSDRPLHWFAGLGLFFGLSGLWLGIVSLLLFLAGEISIVYPASSFLLLWLFGSLLCWGILAELFVKIETTKESVSAS